jgi:predicted branched-subunit amino acid permease
VPSIDRGLIRDVGAVAAASAVVGVSFGAIAVASGVPAWLASAMSVLVFAGGAQFASVAILAGGGSPVTAVLAGLAINARHLPFGLAVADVVGPGWATRLVGSHLMIDESVAFALAQHDPARRRPAYWTCGVMLFVAWNLGVLVGSAAGRAAGDPATLGLDAAFPAGLFALILPALRRRAGAGPPGGSADGARLARRVALTGAVIAVAATPFLPPGVPVLLAVFALAVAWPATRRTTEEVAP